jgi:hypothetical protein
MEASPSCLIQCLAALLAMLFERPLYVGLLASLAFGLGYRYWLYFPFGLRRRIVLVESVDNVVSYIRDGHNEKALCKILHHLLIDQGN